MITDEQIARIEADMLKWAQKQLVKEKTKNQHNLNIERLNYTH